MKHRLTKVQRKVLLWMYESEFVVRIHTGHKQTSLHLTEYSESIIQCQSLVPYFLKANGYIEQAGGIHAYQLTPKGESVAEALRRTS